MIATHRVAAAGQGTVGYLVEGVFYSTETIRKNIQEMDNLILSEDGVVEPTSDLPALGYQEDIIDQKYERLVEENPFVRDIQEELLEWRSDRQHKVLQLEGTRQVGKTTELLKFAYQNYAYVIYVSLAEDTFDFQDVVRNGATPLEFEKYCRGQGFQPLSTAVIPF